MGVRRSVQKGVLVVDQMTTAGPGTGSVPAPGNDGSAAADGTSVLEFRDICVRFDTNDGGTLDVLQDVSFSVGDNEFCAVVGPSGCGKSTLLNLGVGLLKPRSGNTYYRGKPVDGVVSGNIGYITQDSNLLPWCTVLENVMVPLEIRGVGKAERRQRAGEWLDLVGLTGFGNFYPGQLSGGMQKRCSIARTMVYDPEIVFMDEPFGPLDAITRTILQEKLLDLWQQRQKTILFVTHDLHEAIALSDSVVVLGGRPGVVRGHVPVELGRPRDVRTIGTVPEAARLHQDLWTLLGLDQEGTGA